MLTMLKTSKYFKPYTHAAVHEGKVIGWLSLDSEGALVDIHINECPHCESDYVEELDYCGENTWLWECYNCGEEFTFTAVHYDNL